MQSSLKKPSKSIVRTLILLALLGVAMLGLAYWVLITPNNPLTQIFRSQITDHDAKVVVGPYPLEHDFQALKSNSVKTIVSLLDPNLPYENTLLQREQELAAKYGMTVHNFPLTSIFGKKMGDTYQKNAQAAADFIAQTPGKTYLHCYLGMHRVKVVEGLLQATKVDTAAYTLRQGERSQDAKLLDKAQAEYDGGKYADALKTLETLGTKELSAQLLEAWATYKTGNMAQAQHLFGLIYSANPDNSSAQMGLGYTALRQNQLAQAESMFAAVVKADSKNSEALVGLGTVNFRRSQFAQAREHLKAALKLEPANQEAKEILAKIGAKP